MQFSKEDKHLKGKQSKKLRNSRRKGRKKNITKEGDTARDSGPNVRCWEDSKWQCEKGLRT